MHRATHILATDLDGTLVGDAEALQELLSFYSEQAYDVALVYVTGRHLRSALSLAERENLPVPDVLITDVGAEIHIGSDLEKDLRWDEMMTEGWQPEAVSRLAEAAEGLTLQEIPTRCRLSYHADGPETAGRFEQSLKDSGIPHTFVFSSGRDVDVLPAAAGKGRALSYVFDKFGVRDARILIAGDSGNDRDMLELGHPAVIVGNAHPELRRTEALPHVFRASRRCAGGIREAWEHFFS
ncbi:HAD-IIB family hydrolase [Indiicoccus explosivorum]|uniref:HAD-IIB family hydrolase n=1 Tax=Indiicoccus explosivorum TaxID=1917864 RepID=UPI000B442E82|nr:HAD-IIB family hydrolase [Indiicoccus explosivorum]